MTDLDMMDGRYFEHFTLGDMIVHGVPRTLTSGDASLYQALYGGRNPLFCARPVAEAIGLKDCLLYTSPSPRDRTRSRMPSSA